MAIDIRIPAGWLEHPKTRKLARRCGSDGVMCLLRLWLWAAANRPSGDLSGLDDDDIEIAAGWSGEVGMFAAALRALRWVDGAGPEGWALHEWGVYQPWVVASPARSDRARLTRMASTHPALYLAWTRAGHRAITADQYGRLVGDPDHADDIARASAPRADVAAAGAPSYPQQHPLNVALTPAPAPDPDPDPDRKTDPNLSTGLSTGLSTDISTCRALYRSMPGYDPADRATDDRYLMALLGYAGTVDNLAQLLQRANRWVRDHNVHVRRLRGWVAAWVRNGGRGAGA